MQLCGIEAWLSVPCTSPACRSLAESEDPGFWVRSRYVLTLSEPHNVVACRGSCMPKLPASNEAGVQHRHPDAHAVVLLSSSWGSGPSMSTNTFFAGHSCCRLVDIACCLVVPRSQAQRMCLSGWQFRELGTEGLSRGYEPSCLLSCGFIPGKSQETPSTWHHVAMCNARCSGSLECNTCNICLVTVVRLKPAFGQSERVREP